jgi:hypothetical protein
MAADEKKEYPGGIERWKNLREAAAEAKNSNPDHSVVLEVAAELAGLAYILDGIRYNARKS